MFRLGPRSNLRVLSPHSFAPPVGGKADGSQFDGSQFGLQVLATANVAQQVWHPNAIESACVIPLQRYHSTSPHLRELSQECLRRISVVMRSAISDLSHAEMSANTTPSTETLPDLSPNFLPNH